jgi:hypothetical protein
MSTRAHIVVLVATIAAALFILRLVRLRELKSKYALLWLVIGSILLPFGVFPGMLNTVSEWFGIFYSPATFLFVAVGFLFLVVVHYSWELSRLEKKTRVLAEEIALLRARLEESGARAEQLTKGD